MKPIFIVIAIAMVGCAQPETKARYYSKETPGSDVQRLESKIDRLEKLLSQSALIQQQDRTALIEYSSCNLKCDQEREAAPKVWEYGENNKPYQTYSEETYKRSHECWRNCEKLKPLTVAPTGC